MCSALEPFFCSRRWLTHLLKFSPTCVTYSVYFRSRMRCSPAHTPGHIHTSPRPFCFFSVKRRCQLCREVPAQPRAVAGVDQRPPGGRGRGRPRERSRAVRPGVCGLPVRQAVAGLPGDPGGVARCESARVFYLPVSALFLDVWMPAVQERRAGRVWPKRRRDLTSLR